MDEGSASPLILCAGIAVQDFMFSVDRFPTASTKAVLRDAIVTEGGCAANAAIAIVRLGARARFAGPLGDDAESDRINENLARSGVDTRGIVRAAGAGASLSAVFVDDDGERLLATRRDPGLSRARPMDPHDLLSEASIVLADNHFPDFVRPICEAARRRNLPVILDIDRGTDRADPLLALASHAIFSAEALRDTTGAAGLDQALECASAFCPGFIAATDGANGVFFRDAGRLGHRPAFAVEAVDTLAAGDVFHAGFALGLAESRQIEEALTFASAAAALKCEKFGGIVGAPSRAELEHFLAARQNRPRTQ
ncbi:MAG TPA: PfkB family carbohydrate kinase [Stellaceae bacterium]|jgi:sugar/nucleoside kinase (ribokinase family)|nr:PfkB family carbohydrate kinase [Stellaceae bacterium]